MANIVTAQNLFDLTGEVALVTGASSGLGTRFAQVLSAHGAKVIVAARRKDRLDALVESLPVAHALELDMLRPETFADGLAEAEAALGPVTLLVNNAGIAGSGRIADTTPDQWRAVQGTNVDSVWHLSQAFARGVIAKGGRGNIINIASITSFKVGASSAHYAISKAAVLHMTKAMALEWAKHDIRVNAIAPGYIHSEMTDAFLASPGGLAMVDKVPQRRAGDPSDLDGTLLLLASPRASGFMTGSSIVVDGGLLLS